jgi:hypothetical protein
MIWLEPWVFLEDAEWASGDKAEYRSEWETQLRREIGPQHVLFGQPASLIARRFDTDDALFQLSGARVAEVHLTWRRSVEPDPRWPNTTIFPSLEDWARESMAIQHRHWAADR